MRSRSANDFNIPGSPSQWSAWKWVMNTLSMSASPDRLDQLPLRALAAVDQDVLASPTDQDGGQPAP